MPAAWKSAKLRRPSRATLIISSAIRFRNSGQSCPDDILLQTESRAAVILAKVVWSYSMSMPSPNKF